MQKRNDDVKNRKQNIISFIPEGDFYFSKGVAAFQKGKYNTAVKWLVKAIEKAPDDPVYQSQLAVIYAEIGYFEQSNELLKAIVEQYGERYADCYYLLAHNYTNLGLFQTARKYAYTYLKYESDGEFSEEIHSLLDLFDEEDLLQQEMDEEFLTYRERVLTYIESESWDDALLLLKEMKELYPDEQLTKHHYTTALFFSGNKEEAIHEEWRLLRENPLSLMSYLNLSIFFYEIDDKESFHKMINVVQNVYPIHEENKLHVAITLAKTRYYKQAYNRFLRIQDSVVKTHYNYYKWFSFVAYKIGKIDKSNAILDKGCLYYPSLKKEKKP